MRVRKSDTRGVDVRIEMTRGDVHRETPILTRSGPMQRANSAPDLTDGTR